MVCAKYPVMNHSSDEITIHTRKYCRVVLESIDAEAETPESFAVKLATRTHVTPQRARMVVSKLPHTVKSNLTASQANRLKGLLEEIGGRARIENHFVTPTNSTDTVRDRSGRAAEGQGTIMCPECGCEQGKGASYCSFCYRKFRDPASRAQSLEERIPERNPLDLDGDAGEAPWVVIRDVVRRYQLPILIGIIGILVVILVAK
jgi:hypothetical protein